jgi:hypothetical protein
MTIAHENALQALPAPPVAPLSTRMLDDMHDLLRSGEEHGAIHGLSGYLHALRIGGPDWDGTVAAVRRHPIHAALLLDPYMAHSFTRPRGYPGDAGLIDLIYDCQPPPGICERGARLFAATTASAVSQAVRLRRVQGEALLAAAVATGQRVCVLACGHFREGDALDTSRIDLTLVDQDAQSMARAVQRHPAARADVANVFAFLRRAALAGERYDLIYTLGLTDYLNDRALTLLHRLLRRVTAPGGKAVIANFRGGLMCSAWMEAVMDWWLIYREQQELIGFGEAAGFQTRAWLDPSGHILWSELVA